MQQTPRKEYKTEGEDQIFGSMVFLEHDSYNLTFANQIADRKLGSTSVLLTSHEDYLRLSREELNLETSKSMNPAGRLLQSCSGSRYLEYILKQ